MKQSTEKQLEIIALADQGLSIGQIANELALTSYSIRIRAQIRRVQKKVRRGDFRPNPTPIEALASVEKMP